MATILDIAAGMPFTPLQFLSTNFLIDTPLGIALGFDAESPGIMLRIPRSKEQSILTRPLIITAALVGLFMAGWLLVLLQREWTAKAGLRWVVAGADRVRLLPHRVRLRVPQ